MSTASIVSFLLNFGIDYDILVLVKVGVKPTFLIMEKLRNRLNLSTILLTTRVGGFIEYEE